MLDLAGCRREMSELDKWFPRPERQPDPERPPEQGVIDGVKRKAKRRFVKQWRNNIRRKEQDARER